MHKERKQANVVDSVTVIGDVKGKTCIIVDDMVDTAGTLCKAATELKDHGAKEVYACITHGIFSGPAADRIKQSDLKKVIVTDSMP
jgi:ribose-phosphate pyrophosphokinase